MFPKSSPLTVAKNLDEKIANNITLKGDVIILFFLIIFTNIKTKKA